MMGLFGRRDRAAPSVRVTVAAVMKNEGPYVLEWLAWHRMIGVERFIIADNESDDGLSAILAALDAAGVVTRISVPTVAGKAPQIDAYERIARDHAADTEWMFFIDADEFIRPEAPGGLSRFLDTVPENVGAVAVNWAVYGSSERVAPGAGMVMRRFVNRAPQEFSVNRHYKSLVRGKALGTTVRNVHHLPIGMQWRRVDTRLRDLRVQSDGLSREVLWDGLRIQHYVIKSWSEFWLKKVSRGRAAGSAVQRSREFFQAHDRNDIYDPLTGAEHDRLLAEVEALRALLSDVPAEVRDLDQRPQQTRGRSAFVWRPRGNIDSAVIDARGDLMVRGWALDVAGGRLEAPALHFGDTPLASVLMHRIERPDVLRNYADGALDCGFLLRVAAADLPALDKPDTKLQIVAQLGETQFCSSRITVAKT